MRFTLLAAFSLLSFTAQAITNVEEKRAADDQLGWSGKAEVGFDAESGNNEKRKWNLGLNGNWQNDNKRFFTWGSRSYESSNGERTDDDTFIHSRLVLNRREIWSEEFYAQYERDPFAALAHRALIGAGMRYQHAFDEQTRLYQGLGFFHEEVRERVLDEDNSSQLTRLSLYTHIQWRLAYSKLQSTLYFQPSVDEPSDQRALWQLALTLPLGTHTDIKWQWQSRWDTRPPEGTEYHNHQTQLKLVVRF